MDTRLYQHEAKLNDMTTQCTILFKSIFIMIIQIQIGCSVLISDGPDSPHSVASANRYCTQCGYN